MPISKQISTINIKRIMNPSHIISPLAALFITYLIVPVLRKVAIRIQLVDKPNRRKVHQNPVPLVGGISVFIAMTLTLSLVLPFEPEVVVYKSVFIAASILLMMGIIDDRFDLRASLKLAIQLILAHFIFAQGIKIESLHGLFGVYELAPWLQYCFTLVVIAGVVNAYNLMDGIDGLAAGLAIFGFAVFAVLAGVNGQYMMSLIFLTFVGSLLAFLRFNLSKNQKIFMGDAGSLMIGFIMVVSGINMLQSAHNSEYVTLTTLGVVAVMLVPVLDALRVFRRRVKSGKSPFIADKTHLHHLILSTGLKHRAATLAIVGIVGFILIAGFVNYELIGLTLSIVSMLLLFYFTTAVLKFHNNLIMWKNRIRDLEDTNKNDS